NSILPSRSTSTIAAGEASTATRKRSCRNGRDVWCCSASELSGRIASSMAWRDIVPGGVPGGTFRASRQSRTRKSAPESERRSARGDERIAAGALGSDNVFREYEEIEGRAPSSHSIQKRS